MPPTDGVDDVQAHLRRSRAGVSASRDRLDRALHVGLDDDLQLLDLAALDLLVEVLERDLRGRAAISALALLAAAVLGDLRAFCVVLDGVERVARVGHAVEAEDLDRRRRAGLVRPAPVSSVIARTRPKSRAADEGVAERERPVLRRGRSRPGRGRDRGGLDDGAAAPRLFGLALSSSTSAWSSEHLEQLRRCPPSSWRETVHEDRVAAPLLGGQAVLGELALDASRGSAPGLSILLTATMIGTLAACAWLMASMRLRHDAVVGRDDQDDDVRHLGAARAHRR